VKARSDELQIFVSVIECGSISAAAEHAGQTPSAVSRTLSRLEAKLETTLINRTTRRMDLTEEGKFFFERAKQILEQMDELEERLIAHQRTPSRAPAHQCRVPVHAACHRAIHPRVS
jgi:DNA-binding transcriptional LysR family regulator